MHLRGKLVDIRSNLLLFLVMFYYFVIGRNVVEPYLLVPIYRLLGIYPLAGWLGIISAFFRDLGIPVMCYLIYLKCTKQKINISFSLTRLSLKNVLYITVMTVAVRVLFYLWNTVFHF